MRANARIFRVFLWLLFAFVFPMHGGDVSPLFFEDFAQPLASRWQPVVFGSPTDYQVVVENSNACLQARADRSASACAVKLNLPSSNVTTLSWRWKISGCPTNGSDTAIGTFDHAGRVFVAFDSFIGPPYSINYVWANTTNSNACFNHPRSARSRFIAVESGNALAGQWLTESRDIKQDWQRLFQKQPMPKIVGIGVFTDSDGTRSTVTGWYDDIRLAQEPK